MAIETDTLSLDELLKLQTEIRDGLERHKGAIIKDIVEKMHSLNIGLKDIEPFFKPAKGGKSGNIKAKYRNPENADETWTGRGKPPKWFRDNMAKGYDKDIMLIV